MPTNPPRKILALTGLPNTGKNLIANHFSTEHLFHHESIYRPIYQMLKGLLPFDGQRLHISAFRDKPRSELYHKSPQEVTDSLAAWLSHFISPNYLTDRLEFKFHFYSTAAFIIDDLVEIQHAQFLKDAGAKIIHCIRNGRVSLKRIPDTLVDYQLDTSDLPAAIKNLETFFFHDTAAV